MVAGLHRYLCFCWCRRQSTCLRSPFSWSFHNIVWNTCSQKSPTSYRLPFHSSTIPLISSSKDCFQSSWSQLHVNFPYGRPWRTDSWYAESRSTRNGIERSCCPYKWTWLGFGWTTFTCDSWCVMLMLSLQAFPLMTMVDTADDCQVLIWDIMENAQPNATSQRNTNSRLNSPRPDAKKKIITDPVMCYTAPSQVTNLAWSPSIQGMTLPNGLSTATGEWLALCSGKSVRALLV